MDTAGFRFGLEHEFPVLTGDCFVDWDTPFEDLNRVIEDLPRIESDYPYLRVGDLKIKEKRWYIEGFERFSERGEYLVTNPKGFEIRTPICESIDEVVETLTRDFESWRSVALQYGYVPAGTALNPFREKFVPTPALNEWEEAHRRTPEERTAYMHMLTYGPDISFSHPVFTTEDTIAMARRLTYYSPYLVPFSFSSPWYRSALWGGLSYRTYYRTGARPAALVFIPKDKECIKSTPTLTEHARIPTEVGRIEFKAFDCVRDLTQFRALTALVLGVALAPDLPGAATIPDQLLHQRSAREGFADEHVYAGSAEVLASAERALPLEFRAYLDPLFEMLDRKQTPAHAMIESFIAGTSLIECIRL